MSTSFILDLVQIGESIGVVLPEELLSRLKVGEGDSLVVSELPDGIALRRCDPAFAEEMALAREIMRERRDVLRELAK